MPCRSITHVSPHLHRGSIHCKFFHFLKQDPDLIYGIPVIGYRLPDGSYLENKELEPDVYVLNAPETVVKGEDTQLKAAVDELLKELDAKK